MAMKFVGADGCKIGWFYTAINHENVKLKGTLKNMPEIPLIGIPPTRLSGLLFFSAPHNIHSKFRFSLSRSL
jgi:hypothetical protein